MPTSGRVVAVAPAGVVAAGARLVGYVPVAGAVRTAGLPDWARWDGRRVGGRVLPSGWLWVRRSAPALGGCLRRACAAAPGSPAGGPPAQVTAPETGWYFPGWDPLAALPAAALSDLPPRTVSDPPAGLVPGMLLEAGAPAGVLGSPWSALWLVDLPAAAAADLQRAGGAWVRWQGGAGMAVRLIGTGPRVAGRVLAALAADAPGPAPGPPARGNVTLTLPAVRGQLVPTSALLPGGAVAVRRPGGRPGTVPVQVLAAGPDESAVSGLPPGARVLARPWLVRPWLAGSG